MIILVFMFMAGYYFVISPGMNGNVPTTQQVLQESDISSMVSCVAAAHAATLDYVSRGVENADESIGSCVKVYGVSSISLCMRGGAVNRNCRPDPDNIESIQKYVITKSSFSTSETAGIVMKIVGEKYAAAAGMGLAMSTDFTDETGAAQSQMAILSSLRKPLWLSESLVGTAGIKSGDFVYLTQYTGTELASQEIRKQQEELTCAPGEVKVFRFRNWRCEQPAQVVLCSGDEIYDSDIGACVANNSLTPVCGPNETASVIDGVWTCQTAVAAIECTGGQTASYDFEKLEWVCIGNPLTKETENKCAAPRPSGVFSGRAVSNCTDCEKEIQDQETCEMICIPDAAKLGNPGCYPNVAECQGDNFAFYFGFPGDANYVSNAVQNVAGLGTAEIAGSADHSTNRKFNCLDCSPFAVDANSIFAPFAASCKYTGTHSSVCGNNMIFVPSNRVGERGKCENITDHNELIPPCPAGYARATLSSACSPNWCSGDNGAAGIYCNALRPLMVLDSTGCTYCINPAPDLIPKLANMSVDITKNAGNSGWTGGFNIRWSNEFGFDLPVIPDDISGFDFFGGRIISSENIFENGATINLVDSIKWGSRTGMPVPMPIPVPAQMLNCTMSDNRCAPDQTAF